MRLRNSDCKKPQVSKQHKNTAQPVYNRRVFSWTKVILKATLLHKITYNAKIWRKTVFARRKGEMIL